jgi:hypothetical protein
VKEMLAGNDKTSDHIPKAAKAFSAEELAQMQEQLDDDGDQLLWKVTAIIGTHAFGRIQDYKDIQFEHRHWNEVRQRFEFMIPKPVKTRGNKTLRNHEFFVTGTEEIRLLKLYESKVSKPTGQYLKNFNKKNGQFVQNCGINQLSKVPKLIATHLKLDNPGQYKGIVLFLFLVSLIFSCGGSIQDNLGADQHASKWLKEEQLFHNSRQRADGLQTAPRTCTFKIAQSKKNPFPTCCK